MKNHLARIALTLVTAAGLLVTGTAQAQIADPAIAFISSSTPTGPVLTVMNADGSNLKSLVGGKGATIYTPNWSPDGQLIAYQGLKNISVIGKNGGTPVVLVSAAAYVAGPGWSPLGDRIAYKWSNGGSGTASIGEVRAIASVGGPEQLLYRFQYPLALLGGPRWKPDGTRLIVGIYDYSLTTQKKSSLWVIDTVSGVAQDVTHPLGFDWVSNHPADWARHSNRIAFEGAKVGEVSALWILNLDLLDSDPLKALKLADLDNPAPSWSPDDTKLVIQKSGQLWTVDVATGAQALLKKPAKSTTTFATPDWRRY